MDQPDGFHREIMERQPVTRKRTGCGWPAAMS